MSIPQGEPSYWQAAKMHLRTCDSTMKDLIDEFEEPPLRSHGRLFETLARAIVGQQISAKAADAVWGRLLELIKTAEPSCVLEQTPEALRSVGLSGRKVEYIQSLAERADWLSHQPWSTMSDKDVIKQLCTLRGIGPWTAEMMLIFTLLRPDVLPLGDVGVVRCIEKLYAGGQALDEAQLLKIAEPWRPYRTVGVWYLWRYLDAEPVLY